MVIEQHRIDLDIDDMFVDGDHKTLYFFAYAPTTLLRYYINEHTENQTLEEFVAAIKNDDIRYICQDIVKDIKYNDWEARTRRKPNDNYSFNNCFASHDDALTFILSYYSYYNEEKHGLGDVKADILGVTERIEDWPDTALKWKKNMFAAVNKSHAPYKDKSFAKFYINDLFIDMNISELSDEEVCLEGETVDDLYTLRY